MSKKEKPEVLPMGEVKDMRHDVVSRAGLAADFDQFISQAQYRGQSEHEKLIEALLELGKQIKPFVSEQMGREVTKCDVVATVGMEAGKIANGAAFFFVDTVQRGALHVYPRADSEAKSIAPDGGEVSAQRYAAERGRLVVVQGGADYLLEAAAGRARAVLLFT